METVVVKLEVAERTGNDVVIRLSVFNFGPEPVRFDRRSLVGPNGIDTEPWPVSLEPRATNEAENSVLLNAQCFYGRERRFTLSQSTTFHGYLISGTGGGFLPAGPAEVSRLVARADPLRLAPE